MMCFSEADALEFPIIAHVVRAGRTTEDVDRIVVAPHQSIGAEMRNLRSGVAGYMAGECHFQATPRFAILMPRFDLLTFEAGIRVKKRRGQIGP